MTFQALPGFRDFPPEDLAFRSHIQAAWRRVATRYGFVEYDGPPLEPLELYTAKSGDEIVTQLFDFVDKGGRKVAMRPEMTPTFARMVAAHSSAMRKPIRWFSVPQLFRYEKQQKGRLREHFQLNCDLVGEAGPLADAEVIALAIDVCYELGLRHEDFSVRLSDRRLLDALLRVLKVPAEAHGLVMAALDKLGRSAYAGKLDAVTQAAGIQGMHVVELIATYRHARSWEELEVGFARYDFTPEELSVVRAAGADLQRTLEALKAMGLTEYVELDLSIVRGLAYYTGTVFELFDRKGKMRAICGGGRYDDLTDSLGGVPLPAVGFGMGDVVLGELLRDRGLKPDAPASIEVFVVPVTLYQEEPVLEVCHELRRAGVRVEYPLTAGNLGKFLRLADARGARLAIIIGSDDVANGEVQLKDLVGKAQHAVKRSELVAVCKELLSTTG